MKTIARKAKEAFIQIAAYDTASKNKILLEISDQIREHKHQIQDANEKDLIAARKLLEAGALTQPLLDRLVLKDEKIDLLCAYLEQVAKLSDPVGKRQFAMKLDQGLELERVSCPIGVIAVIFESRPEVVIQVSSLSLKSGNAVILKGGTEASHTNRILFELLDQVLQKHGLGGAVNLIETREDVARLLDQDESIDLIIPRGSNAFVRYIQDNTKIPVLGHSAGICHIYVDEKADLAQAVPVIIDSKTDYPSACNAVETLLVHRTVAESLFSTLLGEMREKNILMKGCDKTLEIADKLRIEIEKASEEDWGREYSDLTLSIKLVDSLSEAVDHINRYGSHHTDSILTMDDQTAQWFMQRVDSACVFHNASTRFSDGYVFGLGAEVGISTNKTHSRGPVGLDGMVIYKYRLKGSGQIKATYSGKNPRPFLHSPL